MVVLPRMPVSPLSLAGETLHATLGWRLPSIVPAETVAFRSHDDGCVRECITLGGDGGTRTLVPDEPASGCTSGLASHPHCGPQGIRTLTFDLARIVRSRYANGP